MERIIQLNDMLDTAAFYGVNNQNMICLKNQFPTVKLVARDCRIKASGAEKTLDAFEQALHQCEQLCLKTGHLSEKEILQLLHGEKVEEKKDEDLILYGVHGKVISARSEHQQQLMKAYTHNDLLFAIGPAGSGKTYTAIALAVSALKNKEVKRIILSRPAVEAGEKLGFLPGDMRDKIDPYLQPLYDALQDMIPGTKLNEYMERGIIQIAPLAFMRGRTLSDAVVILDEAQNTTIPQIKMFLTRLGINGKMIVTGDLTQIDLPASQRSGLADAVDRLCQVKGVQVIRFTEKDIVRHPLVGRIVQAYSKQQDAQASSQQQTD